jgi:LysR family transcriptional activator of glutamate synthase operon
MFNPLDLTYLKHQLPSTEAVMALLAFEQEGDLVKAAKLLQTSQPALSFHLKKLEAALDFPLFSVSGKKKVLTRMGKAYVRELQKMVRSYHHGSERILKEAQAIEHQMLRVAGRRELLISFLPFPFPGKLEFLQTTSNEAVEALKKHQVDLAISARLQNSADLVAKLFFESGMKVIYPKQWKKFDLDSILDYPVVAYGTHQAYLADYLKARKIPSSAIEVNRVVEDWFSVVQWVKFGQGWALIPEEWKTDSSEIEEIHISEKIIEKQKVYLYFRKEDRKSIWVKHLETWLENRDH